jgi:hypothetical protein
VQLGFIFDVALVSGEVTFGDLSHSLQIAVGHQILSNDEAIALEGGKFGGAELRGTGGGAGH